MKARVRITRTGRQTSGRRFFLSWTNYRWQRFSVFAAGFGFGVFVIVFDRKGK